MKAMNDNMKKKIPFTVENKKFISDKEILTAREIIELAKEEDIPAAQDDIQKLTIKSKNSIYYKDDEINLLKENLFSLGVRVYSYKVNGEEFQSELDELIVADILREARDKIRDLPDVDWVLQTIGGEQNKFKNDAWVNLDQFNNFLLIASGPTPVATIKQCLPSNE